MAVGAASVVLVQREEGLDGTPTLQLIWEPKVRLPSGGRLLVSATSSSVPSRR